MKQVIICERSPLDFISYTFASFPPSKKFYQKQIK